MRRHWFPKPYADRVAKWRVPAGFLLVAAFALGAQPSLRSLSWGVPLSLLGLVLRGWAAGHLRKNRQLTTGGPYAHTRNPLYLGTLLVALGLAVAARNVWLVALFGAVFALVYLPVIELEEQHLRGLFPEYGAYADRVPLLLPRGRRLAHGPLFSWDLYRHNREYEAALGFLLGLAYLVVRAVW